jgi:hypothetical protein
MNSCRPYLPCGHAAPTFALLQAFLWDVLLPTGNIMLGWSMLMMILLIYLATVLPYAVAFDIDFVSVL